MLWGIRSCTSKGYNSSNSLIVVTRSGNNNYCLHLSEANRELQSYKTNKDLY